MNAVVAGNRRRDLLLTAVLIGILVTPAWLAPSWLGSPWQWVVLVLGVPALWLSWTHAPWQPTPTGELERVAQFVPDGARLCDLGAGDGRVVQHFARRGNPAWGIEASPLLWVIAQVRTLGVPDARVRFGDLYRTDLSGVDVVYVWGTDYSVSQPRFAQRMRATMRPGSRLVSYHYPVVGWDPVAVDGEGQRPLYVYDL